MKIKWLLCFGLIGYCAPAFTQQVNLDNFGKTIRESKPVKIGGGLSGSTVFYQGNDGQGRQPFTYFLNGNVNFNFFNQINLPFTFNLTNLGNNYTYPTLPNRLSVHPTYKWVTGHIGDVAMAFSPYTLNGHMFRGAGFDLTPKGPIKINVMGGRLQKAVEYDPENPLVRAAYERYGYGAKVRYDQSEYYLGMNVFSAKDDVQSLQWKPDSLGILPKSNVAMGWEGGLKLLPNLQLSGEYGLSFMTRDVRAPKEDASLFNRMLGKRTSTEPYRALRAELNYQLLKNTIGVAYERIDPEYATLGAYYFNNDYENVTLRYARPFLHDKLNAAFSWGVQRDNLDNTQEQSSRRFVGSANVDYNPNEKLNFALSFSTYQTYMNIRSQFDYINGQTPYDNLDTLNFSQLSQNLALNTNYNFGKNENRKHNLNANLSFQEAVDKQGDIVKPGALSRFYNLSCAYNLLLVPAAVNFTLAFNTSYNYVAGAESLILGPTAGVRARVFKKKLTTGLSSSYNISHGGGTEARVLNLRSNVGYAVRQRHNLSANSIWQRRDSSTRAVREALTVTLLYAYSF